MNVAKFKAITDMRSMFLGRVGCERGSSFDVSNLGSLGVGKEEGKGGEEDGEGWRMGRMVFSRSAFVAGSAFSTGLVTGADGCLVFGFVWQEGVVKGALMEGIIKRVRCEIERIASE